MAQRDLGAASVQLSQQPHFFVDEKVLCYEPDIKKARVLYDSKVLEVVKKRDANVVFYEYKIHFQGWKDTWDRYVREDNVLKDTDENRDLQRRLYDSAQQFNKGGSKKKNKRKTIREKLQAAHAVKDGCSNVINGMGLHRKDGNNNLSDMSDHETSDEDLLLDSEQPWIVDKIFVPEGLKNILEKDFYYLKRQEMVMLVKLPARKTVVDFMEGYLRHSARQKLRAYIEKIEKLPQNLPSSFGTIVVPGTSLSGKLQGFPGPKSGRSITDIANEELMKTFQKITYSKKIVEDIRIMFDFLLNQILLYRHEVGQYMDFLRGNFNRTTFLSRAVFEELIQNGLKKQDVLPPLILKKAAKAKARLAAKGLLNSTEATPGPSTSEHSTPFTFTSTNCISLSPTNSSLSSTNSLSFGSGNSAEKNVDSRVMPPPPTPSKTKQILRFAPSPVIFVNESSKREEQSKISRPTKHQAFHGSANAEHDIEVIQIDDESDDPATKRRKVDRKGKVASIGDANSQKEKMDIGSGTGRHDHNCRCKNQGKCRFPWACEQLNGFMDEMSNYKMLPQGEVEKEYAHPSLCYGIYHLLRLFVKMPEILNKTTIPYKKMKGIVSEINSILQFFSTLPRILITEDIYDPSVRLYEEDFINEETCHLFSSSSHKIDTMRVAASGLSHFSRRSTDGSRASATPTPITVEDLTEGETVLQIQTVVKRDRRETSATVQSDNGGNSRQAKRRLGKSTSKSPIIIEGNALGVRKSLSQEELSGETLVAPNSAMQCKASPSTSGLKSYSLRAHCRTPYK